MLYINRKICKCKNVYLDEIILVVEKGSKNLKDIEVKTKAMSCCGGCSLAIEKIIREICKNKK